MCFLFCKPLCCTGESIYSNIIHTFATYTNDICFALAHTESDHACLLCNLTCMLLCAQVLWHRQFIPCCKPLSDYPWENFSHLTELQHKSVSKLAAFRTEIFVLILAAIFHSYSLIDSIDTPQKKTLLNEIYLF